MSDARGSTDAQRAAGPGRAVASPHGGRPRIPRAVRTLSLVLFGLAVWLAHFTPPAWAPRDYLDDGWVAAMGHFLATGARAGTDWIFTAGPLAGLQSVVYQPELYWWKLVVWEGLWRLAAIACLVLAIGRVHGGVERALCGLFLLVGTIYFDAWAFATLVAAAVLLDDAERPPRAAVEWIVLAALGAMALVKFTILVATVGLIATLAIARGARSGPRAGIALALRTAAVLAAAWLLAGQGPSDVIPYLTTSWQIASTYSEAQSTGPLDPWWRPLGLLCSAAFVLQLALWTAAGGVSRAKVATALGLAFVVFCAWKTGFVRAADHPTFFFTFAPLAAFLLPVPTTTSPRGRIGVRTLRVAAFAFACIGMVRSLPYGGGIEAFASQCARVPETMGRTLGVLADPRAFRDGMELDLVRGRERLPLHEICARVGAESVDFLGFRQGLILLHGLNWTPRPAFQSYITFTPDLQRRNAEFLAGPRAPRYLISRYETIDGRWPAMDDALALEVVSTRYVPVLRERDYLLLERRAGPAREVRRWVAVEQELGFGEMLPLPLPGPDQAQLLTLDLRPTAAGRLARLLDSAPEITLRVLLEDGSTRTARIVPAMMRSRVLVDPAVITQEDWTDWMLGRPLPRCVALGVDAPDGAAWRFEPTFQARVEFAEGLQPELHAGLEPPAWLRGVLLTAPDRIFTTRQPQQSTVDGQPVAVVHAPSRLTWRIGPGRYRLRVRYGVLPDAAQRDPAAAGEFRVLDASPGEVRVHLRRAFGPGSELEGLGPQEFETTFEKSVHGELVLATTAGDAWAGPRTPGVAAGCYWSEMSLERLGDGSD